MKKLLIKYKSFIICVIIVIVLTIITSNINEIYILNTSNVINIFLILIGFAFTCYTFVYGPLTKIISKAIEKGVDVEQPIEASKRTLKSIKENILFIFICVTVIAFCEFAHKYDFPYLSDTKIYSVMSLKKIIIDFIYMTSIVFSIYAYIDISKSVFSIIENSFDLLRNLDKIKTEE